ncbi:phosphoribosylformylglycinamidine synthase subunit PurL [Campylobacter sp. CNRCH_2016_3089]|uniref:phosphoribosylformylglycinamidine synthase subunit PurL n=1 Tax=unclassified Campylobacter TaxID=2593542 RepID=UPI001DF02065|nr:MULTISPECIES: phosphoribosylformylglycinamidine synthase subunit PurL [unclassified Campylobacter]EGK8089229.1 phosphoribosylformylglycinamidine synthase subunit PurL [Campylobacter lari]MCV3428165.1 phosphoribosylformylglycinamidine synthase subunit PurL [Campylobacter sp. IFREMER_LSEM_CL1904]MCV3479873.1 phosphoribosylformylglycinamidine synthase subunit PurL [Campylobacter sp. CNRCH_2015_1657]MCV3508914.1 phosphoribosylformylglycinamidine synthase subunit PurL [Campylobacter sp. CNRCH_201
MDKEVIKQHKISDEEYQEILNILGREPNLLELGVISAMWSEHCSYKSSKKYLNGFPTKAPWVIQGPGENAGVIDIGKGMAAVFKVESHNHPSFIEPFAGAATGVGGILRDVFTMGARVVAGMNSLKFGNIHDEKIGKHQKYLVKGVVSGISHYGNCMGVPTIGGECAFDECFNGNILVNAFALGTCKIEDIFYAKAEGIGNPVIYVGSKTGRDGLGGAVMASDSFNESSKSLRPTVQIGDPFAEKLLMEACLELFKTDYIVGIQDMGAAGLTSSSFEMAGRSGSGMKLYLDKTPMREEGMTPYELMLSESQERMLICAKKGYEEKVIEIFNKWGLDAAIIGEVTDTGKMELFWHDELVGLIPIEPLSEKAPILDRPVAKPKYLDEIKNYQFKLSIPTQEAFEKLLANENISNKAYIYEQFDSSVQTNTLKSDGALGANSIRIKENNCLLSMAIECNSRLNYVNPKIGAAAAVASAGRKIACSGARPLAISDCLNYGNPQNPEVMWQFAQGCEGIKLACKELNTPVVSGNVSLYNETDGVSIFPSPTIACVGIHEKAENVLKSYFSKETQAIYLIGESKGSFGGSLIAKVLDQKVAGELEDIDFKAELKLWDFLLKANEAKLLDCANSIGIGGLAMTLAKMSAKANLGINVKTNFENRSFIFEESPTRVVIGVKNEENFIEFANKMKINFAKLGILNEKDFVLDDIKISLVKLQKIYFDKFKEYLG